MGAGTAVVLAALAVSLVLGLSPTAAPRPKRHHHHVISSPTIPPTTSPKVVSHLCPLTGQPAAHGKVPRRPAIGVKIGNDPASRPQSGLQAADIVYEEMAEGGITRYLAVYQCRQTAAIGPVRSVRWDDWHVLAPYGHPILAFAGGIIPWERAVARMRWLYDANALAYPTSEAFHRTTNRIPPWNLYTSTADLWKMDKVRTPPPRQFSYRAHPPKGSVRSNGVTIVGFSAGANVVWRWNAERRAFYRSYGSVPDTSADGVQLHATNVIVQVVKTYPGPPESGTSLEVDSVVKGHGRAYVFTGHKVERGTWSAYKYGVRMHLRFPDGRAMTLEPGNTWVEMVPEQYKVVVSK